MYLIIVNVTSGFIQSVWHSLEEYRHSRYLFGVGLKIIENKKMITQQLFDIRSITKKAKTYATWLVELSPFLLFMIQGGKVQHWKLLI